MIETNPHTNIIHTFPYLPHVKRKVEHCDGVGDDDDIIALFAGISRRSDSVLTKKPLSGRVRWPTGAQDSSV